MQGLFKVDEGGWQVTCEKWKKVCFISYWAWVINIIELYLGEWYLVAEIMNPTQLI